jgi:cation diffusion facilitator family transporter
MSTEGGTKAVIAALAANTGIAATKFLAFALTQSSSMLAEAIHSVADAGNQLLLLIGGRTSRREATPEHPFGFGRDRYVYSFLVAVVLFSVGGLFALYEAYHKWHEVQEHPGDMGDLDGRWWWVPLVVLVVAIAMESFSLRTAVKETDKVRGRSSWWQFVRRAKQPELPVVLLEDVAALTGLAFAMLGVGLSLVTKNPVWDVVGTAMIGLLLVTVAVVLALETKSLLLGEAASLDAQARISSALTATPGIDRVIHMKTLHLGPDELLVAVKVSMPEAADLGRVAATINHAERAIREAEQTATVIYIEPDVYVEGHVPAPRPASPH